LPKRENVSGWFSIQKAHKAQLEASKHVIRQDTLPSLVESKTEHVKTQFPYIPTLLSFRETPPAVAAVKKLRLQPDVFLVDGQGMMHHYRLGFASHLGLVLGKPTVGVAKSPLIGKVEEFNDEARAPITNEGEIVGAALITKKGANPLYVSIGHMVSLERAISIVKHCTPNYRIPKPIRLAHNIATEEKQKIQKRSPTERRQK